ncbi:MAG: 6-phosphofructokinase, partial [Clostridia bacterium]
CVDAVRSIRATSRSHDRPAVVQVMGRNAGDLAMRTAIATGAEMVVVPEMEWDVDVLAARLNSLITKGNTRATLIIGEHCWHKMKE